MDCRKALGAAFAAALLVGSLVGVVSAFEDADVRAMVANERPSEEFPDAGGIWMGRQRIVEIDGVGNAQVTEHLIARVLDENWARAQFSPYRRTYWSRFSTLLVLRARIWRSLGESEDLPEGSIVDQPAPEAKGLQPYRYLRERQITFPQLQSGDVVEIRLHWTLRIPGYDLNVRWFQEVMGAEEPVVEQMLTLIQPAAAVTYLESLGPELRSSRRREDGLLRQTWHTGNLPALGIGFIETPWSRIPVRGDTLGRDAVRVLFTTFRDWEAVTQYFSRQWADSWSQRGPAVDEAAAAINAGVKDPEERARAAEAFVRDQIETLDLPPIRQDMWPLPAGDVAAAGAGSPRDKACLLVGLLQAVGLEGAAVMVRTRDDAWAPTFPCLAQLDAYAVRATLPDGRRLWLNPTGESPLPRGEGLILATPPVAGPFPEEGLIPFPGF